MSIWRVINNAEKYKRVQLVNFDEQWEIFAYRFIGKPLLSDWPEVRVKFYRDESNLLKPDIMTLAGSNPLIFTHRALQILGPILGDSIEVLPIKHGRAVWYAINILRVKDCLDQKKSNVIYFSSGRIMDVEKYVFYDNCLNDCYLFKLPEFINSIQYATDAFKEIVEINKLTGLVFIPLT